MPWWFLCILGPPSVCLSITVITALHGLQSNTRLVRGYGRCRVEAVEGVRPVLTVSYYGPWSCAPSCVAKPNILHAACILGVSLMLPEHLRTHILLHLDLGRSLQGPQKKA